MGTWVNIQQRMRWNKTHKQQKLKPVKLKLNMWSNWAGVLENASISLKGTEITVIAAKGPATKYLKIFVACVWPFYLQEVYNFTNSSD